MPIYLYRIEPTRPGMPEAPTDAESKLVGEHFAYLQDAYGRGVVKYVGRTLAPPHMGLAFFEATDDASATDFVERDPGVASGIFQGRAQPFKEIFPMKT